MLLSRTRGIKKKVRSGKRTVRKSLAVSVTPKEIKSVRKKFCYTSLSTELIIGFK